MTMGSPSNKPLRRSTITFFVEWIDDRENYGEERVNLLGMCDGMIIHVTYTERGECIRIISARRAGKDEQEHYYHNDGRQTGVISEAQDLAEQDYHPNHCRHPEGIEGQETEINGAGDSTDEGSQARDAEAQVSRRVACRTTTPEISDQSPPTAAQAPRNR